jgi:hypothetical protein
MDALMPITPPQPEPKPNRALTGLLLGLGWGVEMLAAPAADWLQRAPQSFRQLERKLLPMKKPVEQVKQATEQVERLAGGGGDKSPAVKVKSFDLGSVFVTGAGMLAAVLNYVPYAGAFTTMVVIGMVGLMTFDELWRGLLPPAAILLLHVLESDLVTPMLVGRSLTLPPMMVFLSLTIWTWMWGIAGAMLAVPLLVIVKVMADHLEALQPLGPFLGGPNCGKSVSAKLERMRRLDP